jgi:hypothetical protein
MHAYERQAYERQAYEMALWEMPAYGKIYACERHTYRIVYGRGTHMRDRPMR